jgi:hypothetical protein
MSHRGELAFFIAFVEILDKTIGRIILYFHTGICLVSFFVYLPNPAYPEELIRIIIPVSGCRINERRSEQPLFFIKPECLHRDFRYLRKETYPVHFLPAEHYQRKSIAYNCSDYQYTETYDVVLPGYSQRCV